MAVVSDAHRRLPHLPGQDGPRDRRGGVRRSSDGRLQVRADRVVPRSGTTACSTARPTSTSSAGCWSTRASTTTSGTSTAHHTMVLTDSIDKHERFPGLRSAPVHPPAGARSGRTSSTSAAGSSAREVQPGVFSLDDYDFERPSVDLRLEQAGAAHLQAERLRMVRLSRPVHRRRRHGEQLAQVRGDEFGSQFERGASRATNARGVQRRLDLHARRTSRARIRTASTWSWRRPTISSTATTKRCRSRAGRAFSCKFVAMSTTQQFRPQRITPKPFVQGPQTAVVVGPGGRRDLHRQVRAREGAVPLGLARQEERATARAGSACRIRGRARAGARSRRRASARR